MTGTAIDLSWYVCNTVYSSNVQTQYPFSSIEMGTVYSITNLSCVSVWTLIEAQGIKLAARNNGLFVIPQQASVREF